VDDHDEGKLLAVERSRGTKRLATGHVTGQVGKRTPKRTPNGLKKIRSDKTVFAWIANKIRHI
jgi:hypothetical protein